MKTDKSKFPSEEELNQISRENSAKIDEAKRVRIESDVNKFCDVL